MTIAIWATAALAGSAGAGAQPPLCPSDVTVLYHVRSTDDARQLAMCTVKSATDPVAIVVAVSLTKSGGTLQRDVLIRAEGVERQRSFTLRRYTRPQTTYLKLEFASATSEKFVIYESFEHGETTSSIARGGQGKETVELQSEPLSLMQLESAVSVEPFDE